MLFKHNFDGGSGLRHIDRPDVKLEYVCWCQMLVLGWPTVAQPLVSSSSDYLLVMSRFLCFVIVCVFDLIVSL